MKKIILILSLFLAPFVFFAQDISSNLILHYNFEDLSSGQVPDLTSITGNGTLVRNAKIENGLLDLTNSQGANKTNSNALKLPDNFTQHIVDFTVSTWVKIANPASWGRIFDFGNGSDANYIFLGNNRLGIKNNSGTEQSLLMSSGIPKNEWTHVAVTYQYNNSTAKATAILYKDGVNVGTKTDMTYTLQGLGTTAHNHIGKSQFSADPGLDGYLKDFRIYDRALSAGDVAALSATVAGTKLSVTDSQLALNYYNNEYQLLIFPNGSNETIEFDVPEGIQMSPSSLPNTGGKVLVSSPGHLNGAYTIKVQQGTDETDIAVTGDFPKGFLPQQGIDTLTVDGAWCWFADPRAIYHKGEKEQTYFAWVTRDGHIEIASYDHETGAYNEYRIWENFQADDHANPSMLIRDDGRIIIFMAAHFGAKIYRFISTNPEDITAWGSVHSFSNTVTYPYPFQVGDSICVFYRGGSDWHPRLSVSTDNGQTFDDGRLFISGGGQRPYTRYFQGNDGSIHVAVTTGHPRNESSNKIHYCRFKGNKVYRANGTLIKDVTNSPVDLSQLEVVYDASAGKGWIWDIALEPETGYPIMVYASFPSDTDHRYHYARWNGTSWDNTQLTKAGRWFPQTPVGANEPEPNYSGGIILDTDNPSTVYLSKEVQGTFEIFKYTTEDKGQTWSEQALTWNTPSHLVNVRPVVPRNHAKGFFDVIWMRGTYVFYANQQYNTALVFPEMEKINTLTALELDSEKIHMFPHETTSLTLKYIPFFTAFRDVVWESSNESVATVVDGKITAVAPGITTISAVGVGGVSVSCEVQVLEVLSFFDFGTASSPLAQGAIRISEQTRWNTSASYGWMGEVASRDRGAAWNDEIRDFNMSGVPVVFRVKVDNGDYIITLKQGDTAYMHDKMTVKVNGEVVLHEITSQSGQLLTNSFAASTQTGYFDFEFSRHGEDLNWVVNSLRISPVENTNVATKNVNIDTFNHPDTHVSVFDVSGRFIFQSQLRGKQIHTLLTEKKLLSGVYIINMSYDDRQLKTKYILQF